MVYATAWDENKPAGTRRQHEIDNIIREFERDWRQRMDTLLAGGWADDPAYRPDTRTVLIHWSQGNFPFLTDIGYGVTVGELLQLDSAPSPLGDGIFVVPFNVPMGATITGASVRIKRITGLETDTWNFAIRKLDSAGAGSTVATYDFGLTDPAAWVTVSMPEDQFAIPIVVNAGESYQLTLVPIADGMSFNMAYLTYTYTVTNSLRERI